MIILNKNKNVTLAYDAEDVCMQIGDILNYNVNYYNWEYGQEIPEIKTSDSIIISFYRHKGKYEHDSKLVNIIKPLFEHPEVTLITFDFTFDFDKLYDYGIKIKTNKIIDVQLSKLPEETIINENKDFICSKGWSGIKGFVSRSNEDNVNSCIIHRAKESVKNGKKDFPHNENNLLVEYFKYPPICKFTKTFLEYSAADIFYTAIVGVDLLSRGELDIVKERSQEKFQSFIEYRNKYGNARDIRSANYVGDSFTSAMQAQFSNESQTYQLLSYHKTLKTYVSSFEKYKGMIESIIPNFTEEDKNILRGRYNDIVEILKNPEYVHLGNIKDNAILAFVNGIESKPAFVLRNKEDDDEVQENKNTPSPKKPINPPPKRPTNIPNNDNIPNTPSKIIENPVNNQIEITPKSKPQVNQQNNEKNPKNNSSSNENKKRIKKVVKKRPASAARSPLNKTDNVTKKTLPQKVSPNTTKNTVGIKSSNQAKQIDSPPKESPERMKRNVDQRSASASRQQISNKDNVIKKTLPQKESPNTTKNIVSIKSLNQPKQIDSPPKESPERMKRNASQRSASASRQQISNKDNVIKKTLPQKESSKTTKNTVSIKSLNQPKQIDSPPKESLERIIRNANQRSASTSRQKINEIDDEKNVIKQVRTRKTTNNQETNFKISPQQEDPVRRTSSNRSANQSEQQIHRTNNESNSTQQKITETSPQHKNLDAIRRISNNMSSNTQRKQNNMEILSFKNQANQQIKSRNYINYISDSSS